MIQQYDEEQILLERRVAELENLVQQDEIKQVDASRFIALVKKYRDCEELTDTMRLRTNSTESYLRDFRQKKKKRCSILQNRSTEML